ncbi:MAG TPA: BTAD domain-containing putative transcriptional regulator [Candidatus Cybelea sp.]
MDPATARAPGTRNRRGNNAGRLFVVLLISGFSILLTLASIKLLFVPMGWLGLDLDRDVVVDVDPQSAAAAAGLRPGDQLAPGTPFFLRQRIAFSNHFGRADYSFDVVRGGRLKHITAVATKPEPNLGPVGYGAFPIFGASVFAFLVSAIVATLVLLLRPSRLTWSFYLFCIGAMLPWFGSLALAQTVPMPYGFLIQIVRVTLMCVGLFAGLDFALRFPSGEAAGWRKPVAWSVPFFATAYVAWWWLAWLTGGSNFPDLDPYDWVDIIAKCAVAVVSVAAVAGTYLSSAPTQRQRLTWAVIGIALGYPAIAGQELLFRLGLFHGILQFVTWCLVLAAYFAPLSVAYAIVRYRVIDVRFVLTRGLAYLILSVLLAAAMALTYWATNLFLQQTHVAAFVQLAFAVLLGVILMRAYSLMDSGITRLFFRQHYAALRKLSTLPEGLSRAESVEELERLVASEPAIALDLVEGGVYRQTPGGWYVQMPMRCEALPPRLDTGDPLITCVRAYTEALRLSPHLLEQLGGSLREQPLALAMPLCVDGALSGVALYGAHANGSDLDPQEVGAIVALQRPAELALRTLLRRTEQLRELADLIARAPSNAAMDPYGYLANRLIDALPPRTRTAVVACASIPEAGVTDITNATEESDSIRLINDCTPLCAVVQLRETKAFDVHPLIVRTIEQRFPEQRRDMLVRCGRAAAETGDHARASRLLHLAGLHTAAALELENHLSQQDPQRLIRWVDDGSEYAYDGVASPSHPHSWLAYSASQLYRESSRVLLNEGRRLANAASQTASPVPFLAVWLAFLQAEAGEPRAANGTLTSISTGDGPTFSLEFASMTRALVLGRLGNVARCAQEGAGADTTETCRGLNALIRAAHVERMHGDWNSERSLLDFAIEALRAEDSRFVVWALAEAATGAWFAGDEHAREAYLEALRAAVIRFEADGFVHFAAAPSKNRQPSGREAPRWLAVAYLSLACAAKTWGEARDHANHALAAATDAQEPFLRSLAHLASAEFDEDARQEHFRNALRESRKVESPALASAVRAVISSDAQVGMLVSFITNLRKDRETDEAALVVEAAAGRVRRGRLAIALSERELAVVLAIARSQNATPGAELADLIWPDLDEAAGSHAVQTCMHRLRQRLGDRGIIEKSAYGYRLRDGITVDLMEIEPFVRRLQGDEALDEFTTLRLAALARRLDISRPAFMAAWEWFRPIERRIEEWRRFARYRLGCDALARNDFDTAVTFAQSIVSNDELDEPAWELAIRAFVEKGDRAAAQRELRRYREVTLRELNAEPSPHLYRFVESVQERSRRLRIVGD